MGDYLLCDCGEIEIYRIRPLPPMEPLISVGTKSVLFGVHCFFIHPFFVAWAWIKLYGFPWHPLIWISFFVHDLGYLGKPNMDGPEGEEHVHYGAWIMGLLGGMKWHLFTLCHSRFTAKEMGLEPSALCFADKFSFCVTPRWLYIIQATLSGEVWEYMKHARPGGKNDDMDLKEAPTVEEWHASVDSYLREWVKLHIGGSEDTWTRSAKQRQKDAEKKLLSAEEKDLSDAITRRPSVKPELDDSLS